ncbi:MAG: hypothetical protein IPL92_01590 [Saprospiraceae bacterium]|nr:hypothetical protein [Candidatus Opimibacter iunctus]
MLFGFCAALAAYYLTPILSFNQKFTIGTLLFLSGVNGLVAFVGSTNFFHKNAGKFALWTLPLILIQLTSNVLLTYAGIQQSGLLAFCASTLTVPTATLWFIILRSLSIPDKPVPDTGYYTVAETFSGIGPRIAGVTILMLTGLLVFYRLGYYDIWEDENLVINAAKGFYENGFAYFEEGYDRAWLHTSLVAGSFHLFGISEWAGRFPSAIFGLVFVIVCFFVFARWFGLAWLALLIPLVCMMNDRFLILFRYMRMYALLIPLFLIAVFLIYRAVMAFQLSHGPTKASGSGRKWIYAALAIGMLPIMAHVHKLSMVLLPVTGLFILYLVLIKPTRQQMQFLWIALGAGALMLFFTFVVQLDALRMFRQVANRIFSTHQYQPDYFGFVFENGLPLNSTIMFLLAGLGLLGSRVSRHLKSFWS